MFAFIYWLSSQQNYTYLNVGHKVFFKLSVFFLSVIKHYLGKHNDEVYMTFCMVGSECNNREEDCSLFFVFNYWMFVGDTRDVITTIAIEQKQLKKKR